MKDELSDYCRPVAAERAISLGATQPPITLQQGPRPLVNPYDPQYNIKHEKLEHRAVLMLKASGMTNKEIGEACGLSPAAVSYITKQPWAVEQILKEVESAGRDQVLHVIRDSALDAVNTVADIMQDEKASKDVRLKAAREILDREYGRAVLPIQHTHQVDLESLSDEELAKIVMSGGRKN